MYSIGNDIVDLELAKAQNNWKRKGFLEKLFTKKEQEKIINSNNPFLTIWLFWSMKEAAYKCYVQEFKIQILKYPSFYCSLLNSDLVC